MRHLMPFLCYYAKPVLHSDPRSVWDWGDMPGVLVEQKIANVPGAICLLVAK